MIIFWIPVVLMIALAGADIPAWMAKKRFFKAFPYIQGKH